LPTYSIENYRFLLRTALDQGYHFVGFLDPDDGIGRRIYLRHDVDYSLEMAVELARVDAEFGIASTFCLLVRSQIYNLLSKFSLQHVDEILTLGHSVALHYAAPAVLPSSDAELAALVLEDFSIVQRNVTALVLPAFAWHNVTAELISRGLNLEIPGLANIYGRSFIRDIPYFSDSNMRYSVGEFEEIIGHGRHRSLHLLFHPLNWVAGGGDMMQILVRTWPYVIRERELDMRLNREWAKYAATGIPTGVLDDFVTGLERSLRNSGPTSHGSQG